MKPHNLSRNKLATELRVPLKRIAEIYGFAVGTLPEYFRGSGSTCDGGTSWKSRRSGRQLASLRMCDRWRPGRVRGSSETWRISRCETMRRESESNQHLNPGEFH